MLTKKNIPAIALFTAVLLSGIHCTAENERAADSAQVTQATQFTANLPSGANDYCFDSAETGAFCISKDGQKPLSLAEGESLEEDQIFLRCKVESYQSGRVAGIGSCEKAVQLPKKGGCKGMIGDGVVGNWIRCVFKLCTPTGTDNTSTQGTGLPSTTGGGVKCSF